MAAMPASAICVVGLAGKSSALHWQGMVWDHLSNLDEEDVRAIIAYLRTLPPLQPIFLILSPLLPTIASSIPSFW